MTTPKSKEETLAQMTADAKLAREEFNQMVKDGSFTLTVVSAWWERWYQKAGHKRLAYILMGKKLNGE